MRLLPRRSLGQSRRRNKRGRNEHGRPKKDGATLAVSRVDAPSFPHAFEVSAGHAMVAGTALQGPVDIVARLSKTGDAIPNAGDLEGTAGGVAVPSEGIRVTIDQVLQ